MSEARLNTPAALTGVIPIEGSGGILKKYALPPSGPFDIGATAAVRNSLPKGSCGGLPALEPLVLDLEWMHSCCGCLSAIGLPFLVVVLVLGSVGRAGSICGDVECLNPPDAQHTQAPLCKQVLAHWSILAILDTHLPMDLRRCLAHVDVCDQGFESSLAKNFQVAEVAVVYELA